jgi:AcrR family transcriptional regulator
MAGTRAAATMAKIRTAALELAAEDGYDHTTVDRICDRAGISQRTFFNHFPTKQAVYLDHDGPCLDEDASRRFLLADGPLLTDALAMIAVPDSPEDSARMTVVAATPELLAAHVAQMTEVDKEVRDLVLLRLRHRNPTASAADQEQDATMVASLLGGVVRWAALTGAGTDAARTCLDRVTRTHQQ